MVQGQDGHFLKGIARSEYRQLQSGSFLINKWSICVSLAWIIFAVGVNLIASTCSRTRTLVG